LHEPPGMLSYGLKPKYLMVVRSMTFKCLFGLSRQRRSYRTMPKDKVI